MCLAVPGRIISCDPARPLDDGGLPHGALRMGQVDFGGVIRPICLACVPEAGVGDYVIVHAGFAISHLDEAEARATLALLAELDASP